MPSPYIFFSNKQPHGPVTELHLFVVLEAVADLITHHLEFVHILPSLTSLCPYTYYLGIVPSTEVLSQVLFSREPELRQREFKLQLKTVSC